MRISERAGTQLDHRFSRSLTVKNKRYGLIDESKSLYQFGGSAQRFVLWKLHLLGLGVEEWEIVSQSCKEIEFIDHDHNQCWAISVEKAQQVVRHYNVGAGPKVGIPIEAFDKFDSEGTLTQEGK